MVFCPRELLTPRLSRSYSTQFLALLGGYDVNATRYLGHFLAVTLRAPYLRCLVLRDGFGALEGFAAFFTTILVSRHVRPPHRGSLLVGMAGHRPSFTHRMHPRRNYAWCSIGGNYFWIKSRRGHQQ